MGRVVHFELSVENPELMQEFFNNTFGWNFQKWGEEQYWLANTGETQFPGINGAFIKKREGAPAVVNNISVDNIDSAIESIMQNGGEIVVPKFLIPNVGYIAYFKDPEQNIHGISQFVTS